MYRLAEKFGTGVFDWNFDRIQTMLLIMGEDAKIQKEAQRAS